jgi:Rieske Fe-S protein
MLASVFYPVLRYLVPPELPEAPTTRALAAREGDLRPNQGRVFRFGSRAGLLVRLPDGNYRAFDGTCTHLNCTVQYRPDLQQIWCACHNGYYDLGGRNVAGPPPRPLDGWEVHVVNGEVVVTRKA